MRIRAESDIVTQDINIVLLRHGQCENYREEYFQIMKVYTRRAGILYEQTEGVLMGSPISLWRNSIKTTILKPKVWYRFVDDTFIISMDGTNFRSFLHRMTASTVTSSLQLPFLDVMLTKKRQSIGNTLYRKQTHPNPSLHRNSNRHPCQNYRVVRTLTERAKRKT